MTHDIAWTLNRTVPPIGSVVSLSELKSHLRITWDEEDADIESFGASAEETVENELSAALLTQAWVLRLGCFPRSEIPLPRPPLQSVTSVQYVDADGVTRVLATTEYTVESPPANSQWQATPGRIHLAFNKSWPVTRDIPNAVIVTYVTGKATGVEVPEMVRMAIKQTVGDLHENRERSALEVLQQLDIYERLVANHRCVAEFRYA